MKINTKKITSIALATLIMVGSTSIYATGFNDVPSNHWAKDYIKKGRDLGFINGVSNVKFAPNQEIDRMQVIALAARVLNLPKAEVDQAKMEHQINLLTNYVKIADEWIVEDLSVALSKGIVTESDLTKLYSDNGAKSAISREEVAVFITRAMGLEKDANNKGNNIILPFKDADKIDRNLKSYVAVMNDHKILEGDENRSFNPKNSLTRAQMSKIISMAHDHIENEQKKNNQVINLTGTILDKISVNSANYIRVEDVLGVVQNYEIDSQSVLKIDNDFVSYDDLRIGLEINAEVLERTDSIGLIKSLKAENDIENYKGTIYDVNSYTKYLTIEYEDSKIINRKAFVVDDNAEILLDGNKASLSDLRESDKLKVKVVNGRLTKIEAEAKVRNIKGILKEISAKKDYITVEDKDGNIERYILDKDVEVKRDGRRSELRDLRKGDKVDIHIEDKVVLEIKAEKVEIKLEGIIKSITTGRDKIEITISNNATKKDETYIVPRDATIDLDEKRSKLEELQWGQFVEVTLEGEEIVEIDAFSTTINNKRLARISHVGRTYLEVILENGDNIDVILEDTEIKDQAGDEVLRRSLKKGDEILITGDIYNEEIFAREILLFSK